MIITTGIQKGPVVSRVELRTFFQDKDLTNLYVLATDQMMRIPQDDLTSWFQIAAIHGRPYIPYDGVGVKGNFGGYCTHSSVLFPSWHRPYVALFEQCLSKHVHEIANEYKNPADKARYVKAAERFRLPYWDWATEPTLPDIIATQEMIDVHLPDGSSGNIRNPLFGYNFNPVYSDFGDGLPDEKTWEAWQATYRYPTTTDSKAVSKPKDMQDTLKNNRLTLRDRTYNILTQIKDYVLFSHDTSNGDEHPPAGYDSIESIHNQIHGLAGANGHMGVVDYAAFDPVFFMHHANVDRMFAIWQGLHPDAYVTPLKSEAGTFTRKPGEIENVESPLTPFRRTANKFWDSTGVRDTRVFNYTYPEFENWDALTGQQRLARLALTVNKLYGPVHVAPAGGAPVHAPAPVSAPAPAPHAPAPVPAPHAPAPVPAPYAPAPVPAPHAPAPVPAPHAPAPAPAPHAPAPAPAPAPHAPSGGEHAPSGGGHAPSGGEHTPSGGAHAPAGGAHAPSGGGHAPSDGGHAPSGGGHAPSDAGYPPTEGSHAPAGGAHEPSGGVHGASGGTHAPSGGAHGPIGGSHAPAGAPYTPSGTGYPATGVSVPAHHATSIPKHTAPRQHHEWMVNIAVEKYAVKSSFFVHIFLGEFDNNHKSWGRDPGLVGSHVIFANNAHFTGCERCRHAHEKKKVVTGTIPLTGVLVEHLGGIENLTPDKVTAYLQQHLHWRIQKHDHTPIDVKDVPSLKVSVGHAPAHHSGKAEEFPSWGDITLHSKVTAGRAGGA